MVRHRRGAVTLGGGRVVRTVTAVVLLAVLVSAIGTVPAQAGSGTLSVHDVTVDEPATGFASVIFIVNLSRSGADPLTVKYATVDGAAKAGEDYVGRSGTLDFGTN